MASAEHGVWYSLIYKDQDSESGRVPASFPLQAFSWPSILSVLPWNRIQNLGPWTESLWWQLWRKTVTFKEDVYYLDKGFSLKRGEIEEERKRWDKDHLAFK